jgi:Kae1-associated kinase Bud32
MNYLKVLNEKSLIVLAVDKWIFERDVDRGFLGETLAGGLIFPYRVIENEGYLHSQEVKLKKRLVLELLENLALGFPELSSEIYIKPEYFMYETMLNRDRLFPPMIYSMFGFVRSLQKEESALNGYLEALRQLEKAGVIGFSDGFVRIPAKFVDNAQSPRVRFTNLSKTAPRALFASLLGIFPQVLNFLSQDPRMYLKFQREIGEKNLDVMRNLVDPQKYLFVPTARGLVSLADKSDVKVSARKVLSVTKAANVDIKRIGGVLNDVYLIKASNDAERKAVLKSFKDWSSFKWFPLALWTVGTRTFAVLGRSRLERECAINEILLSKGFDVPKILHVSHSQRSIFMEYVEGASLDKLIKKVARVNDAKRSEEDLKVIMRVGETIAKVHALNICLGDTKPENIIIGKNGEIYLLDFEQASRKGDKAWDVAEFLYYAGHYVSSLSGKQTAEFIAKFFIRGYLEAEGNVSVVKKAANPKYTRVFSVFTSPIIMFAVSGICKKADQLK